MKRENIPVFRFPADVKLIDLWAWGSNFDYYAEAHVTDYRGITHVLPLGNLKYEGWRNLKVRIPNYIPQGKNLYSENKAAYSFKNCCLDKTCRKS